MTDERVIRILHDYLDHLDDEAFMEDIRDLGDVPVSPFLLWRLFVSYTEHFLCDSTGLQPQVPAGGLIDGVTALEALAAARALAEQLQGARWWMAGEARKQGHSWAEIGAALGMSKQSAWEGFRKYAAEPWMQNWPSLHGECRALAGDSSDG